MKFIIKQFLIAVALISIIYESQCERDVPKKRLVRVIDKINAISNKSGPKQGLSRDIARKMDIECVKNFLNLPQNDKIIVNPVDEAIFYAASAIKCSDEDKIFKYYFDNSVEKWFEEILSCLKWHLQQFEPNSKLVENFDISEDDIKECTIKYPIKEQLEKLLREFVAVLGPLSDYSCGAVTGADDLLKFISKGSIIKFGNFTEELKKDEKQKLKEYFKDIILTTAKCIIKRFEDDPVAYLINDTLNYYYKKSIESIDLKFRDSNKGALKLEAYIDQECVKEKLNLPEFGDKALLKIEATFLIASAKSKCIKIDPIDFSYFFITYAVDDYKISNKNALCAKYGLREFEPTSKLAKISSDGEDDETECNYFSASLYIYTRPVIDYHDSVGRLNQTSCGAITEEDVDVIAYKTFILANEKDGELKKSETMELFTTVTDKLNKLADCILERIK